MDGSCHHMIRINLYPFPMIRFSNFLAGNNLKPGPVADFFEIRIEFGADPATGACAASEKSLFGVVRKFPFQDSDQCSRFRTNFFGIKRRQQKILGLAPVMAEVALTPAFQVILGILFFFRGMVMGNGFFKP